MPKSCSGDPNQCRCGSGCCLVLRCLRSAAGHILATRPKTKPNGRVHGNSFPVPTTEERKWPICESFLTVDGVLSPLSGGRIVTMIHCCLPIRGHLGA